MNAISYNSGYELPNYLFMIGEKLRTFSQSQHKSNSKQSDKPKQDDFSAYLDYLENQIDINSQEWSLFRRQFSEVENAIIKILKSNRTLSESIRYLAPLIEELDKKCVDLIKASDIDISDLGENKQYLPLVTTFDDILVEVSSEREKSLIQLLKNVVREGEDAMDLSFELPIDGLKGLGIEISEKDLLKGNFSNILEAKAKELSLEDLSLPKGVEDELKEFGNSKLELMAALFAATIFRSNSETLYSENRVIDLIHSISISSAKNREQAVIYSHFLTALKHREKGIRRIERFIKIRETNYPRFEKLINFKIALHNVNKSAEEAGLSDMTMEQINQELNA